MMLLCFICANHIFYEKPPRGDFGKWSEMKKYIQEKYKDLWNINFSVDDMIIIKQDGKKLNFTVYTKSL